MRRSLRVLLTSRQEEWQRFDALFEAYWSRPRPRARAADDRGHEAGARPPAIWQDHLGDGRARSRAPTRAKATDGDGRGPAGRVARGGLLRRTDLRHVADPEALRGGRADRVSARAGDPLPPVAALAHRGGAARRSISGARSAPTSRSAASRCCSPTRARPERPVRLVVLLDVSGSMQPYAARVPAVRQGAGGELGACRRLSVPHPAGAGHRRAARDRLHRRR